MGRGQRQRVRIYGPDGSRVEVETRIAAEMQLFDGERVRTDQRMLEILTANAAFLLERLEDKKDQTTRLVLREAGEGLSEVLT